MLSREEKEFWQRQVLFFADCYRFPEQDFFQELQAGKWHGELKEKPFQLNFQELKEAYIDCFLGAGKESAPPIESIYKIWTEDGTAQVAIAKQKGYLMGDSALHIKYLLKALGFELPSELAQKPDHLAVLLELLAYYIEHLEPEEVLQYLKDHFDWLGEFQKCLEHIGAHEFYLFITVELIKGIQDLRAKLELLSTKREVS